MGKTKKQSVVVASATTTLSPEEFQKLTPDEQLAYIKSLTDANAVLASNQSDLETQLAVAKQAVAEADKSLPVVEGVEADELNDVEAGNYQWTAPAFTWDDNSVINVVELMEGYNSDNKKVSDKAELIIAKLLARHSGLLVRKED